MQKKKIGGGIHPPPRPYPQTSTPQMDVPLTTPPWTTHPPRTKYTPPGLSTPPGTKYPPWDLVHTPPLCGQTDACKNITWPRLHCGR